MRSFILLTLTVFISTILSAKCANSGIRSLSKSSVLNRNGLIILEFYASSQAIVQDINKKYPIYLKTKKEKVILLAIEVLKGEFQITQVIFKPSSELMENEVYELHIDNLPGYESKPETYNASLRKREALTFHTNNIADIEQPVFAGIPVETKKTMVEYGCGPARWVDFRFSEQDKSETFVITSVKNMNTGKLTKYILPIENGVVKVGHGMCGGAFHFDNGEAFEVSFTLLDQSGNKSHATPVISFQKPTVSTYEE